MTKDMINSNLIKSRSSQVSFW